MKKIIIVGLVIFIGFFLAATLVWFVHEKDVYKKFKFNKKFDDERITQLDVNSFSSKIEITKGKDYRVRFYGNNDLKVKAKNDKLSIVERRSSKRGYSFNLNPFNQSKNYIRITIPEDKIKNLNINSGVGRLNIHDIKLKHADIRKDSGPLNISNAKVQNVNFNNETANLNINNSIIKNSRFKGNVSEMRVNESNVKDSLFLVEKGFIDFKHMASESDIKASIKQGSIHLSYKTKPENTLLKLYPGAGKAKVNNKYFEKGKVGQSDNVIEFYTIKDDIIIK
ncbi:putative adhesin [Staphylococcus caledonicus]|uniref:DUF4097 family beta strand repeat-containing protein n=1 Tax=Staphylococcus TaxID=1279 RepID=UPI001F56C657|nr:DUF4097 family beta strand repeat-containing protein [Staphylococcus sp. acrmy]MCI2948579.1 DUF4097 domain-containing protein [Staphylococcus sp. acrmy]